MSSQSPSLDQMETRYTSASGRPLASSDSKLRSMPDGLSFPNLDLIEMLSQLNRERVPERVVHAKGAGAYGEFEVSPDSLQHRGVI